MLSVLGNRAFGMKWARSLWVMCPQPWRCEYHRGHQRGKSIFQAGRQEVVRMLHIRLDIYSQENSMILECSRVLMQQTWLSMRLKSGLLLLASVVLVLLHVPHGLAWFHPAHENQGTRGASEIRHRGPPVSDRLSFPAPKCPVCRRR